MHLTIFNNLKIFSNFMIISTYSVNHYKGISKISLKRKNELIIIVQRWRGFKDKTLGQMGEEKGTWS